MNAPDQGELFEPPIGHKIVEYDEDKKIQNAGCYTIYLEDHTLGNLLRKQLLEDKRVLFAGYRIPHPLENKVEVKIHTDGQITPHEALFESIDLIKNEMTTLQTQFVSAVDEYKKRSNIQLDWLVRNSYWRD